MDFPDKRTSEFTGESNRLVYKKDSRQYLLVKFNYNSSFNGLLKFNHYPKVLPMPSDFSNIIVSLTIDKPISYILDYDYLLNNEHIYIYCYSSNTQVTVSFTGIPGLIVKEDKSFNFIGDITTNTSFSSS